MKPAHISSDGAYGKLSLLCGLRQGNPLCNHVFDAPEHLIADTDLGFLLGTTGVLGRMGPKFFVTMSSQLHIVDLRNGLGRRSIAFGSALGIRTISTSNVWPNFSK